MTPVLDRRVGAVRVLVTGRPAGGGRFEGNVGLAVGDDPAAVAANRAAATRAAGLAPGRLLFLHQVHGARVLGPGEVDEALRGGPAPPGLGGGPAPGPTADGAVVATPGSGVAVTAADCLPLLLADGDRPLAAAAHVGRRGLVLGVGPAALEAFRAAGGERPVAVLGPAIGPCCYEVGADVRDEAEAAAPGAAARTSRGTPAVDLRAALRRQLAAAGLPDDDMVDVDRCTAEDGALFSYRRDRSCGRFAGVVSLPS